MDRRQFTDALGSRGACIRSSLHRTHITAHHHGHISATDILTADQRHICGFDHRVRGFDRADQTLGLNHLKYNGLIRTVGRTFAVVVPALFALIPVLMYLN